MRILALEPFYGGSHRAFLDSWIARSTHRWTLLSLPATKWKWRMRHAAITMAETVAERARQGERWDLLFATDMLNLAEFQGLTSRLFTLPGVVYFHENQLTYPVREERERDYHFAMSNIATCRAADEVWFNSKYHRDSFCTAITDWLSGMPDHRMPGTADAITAKSGIFPPGVEPMPPRPPRRPGPLHILW